MAFSISSGPIAAAAPPAPAPATKHHSSSLPVKCIERQRRVFLYSIVGAGLTAAVSGGGNARAAGRRPPPPPPKEKKDPSMGALQAKVLASIKRKEAMKEAMAQLRQRGKPIDETPK